MTQLWPRAKRPARVDCLNGIAYNKSSGEFLLTGKLWPQYYAVKLADDSPSEL